MVLSNVNTKNNTFTLGEKGRPVSGLECRAVVDHTSDWDHVVNVSVAKHGGSLY
jgi:hypothetical protein